MTRVDAEILTVDDLAKLFACDKETAAARLTSGDLPGVKVGRGWVIPRQALFERINEKAREEAAARRARQSTTIEAGKSRSKTIKATTTPPSAIQEHATHRLYKGRKRRIPPNLPPLNTL